MAAKAPPKRRRQRKTPLTPVELALNRAIVKLLVSKLKLLIKTRVRNDRRRKTKDDSKKESNLNKRALNGSRSSDFSPLKIGEWAKIGNFGPEIVITSSASIESKKQARELIESQQDGKDKKQDEKKEGSSGQQKQIEGGFSAKPAKKPSGESHLWSEPPEPGTFTIVDNDTGEAAAIISKKDARRLENVEKKLAKAEKESLEIQAHNLASQVQRHILIKLAAKLRQKNYINTNPTNMTSRSIVKELFEIPEIKEWFKKQVEVKAETASFNISHAAISELDSLISELPTKYAIEFDDENPSISFTDSDDDKIMMSGTGLALSPKPIPALSNYDIDAIVNKPMTPGLKKLKSSFRGVYAVDTLRFAKLVPGEINSVIVNTSPIPKGPAEDKPGHWIALRIDGKPGGNVEYYDPLSFPPDSAMEQAIKNLVSQTFDNGKPSKPRQFKINRLRDQAATSQTCGWHSLRFLANRALGRKFKVATGFNKLGEEEATRLMKHQFGDL